MSWRDRITELWNQYGGSYPLEFVIGWVGAEQTNNAAAPTALPLGEVGWFQISADEQRALGLDGDRIRADEVYSFTSGMKLVDYYASRVDPGQYRGSAFYGMTKLWHTLPSLAKLVAAQMGPSSSWSSVADWIRSNITSAQVGGRDVNRLVNVVDRVMAYDSSSIDLSLDDIFGNGETPFDLSDISDAGGSILILVAIAALAIWSI